MRIFKRQAPYKRQLFAVTTGDYVGEMLAYMGTDKDTHKFISVPKLIIRSIPVTNFQFGLDNGIVELVELLPRNVFNLLKKQFIKNEKLNI
jgi:hypothetical protein